MVERKKTVPMPQKFHLSLLIHAHQPCGNFEHVLEKAYDSSYLPFIEHLEKASKSPSPASTIPARFSPGLRSIDPEYVSRLKKVGSGRPGRTCRWWFLRTHPGLHFLPRISTKQIYAPRRLSGEALRQSAFPARGSLEGAFGEPQLPTALGRRECCLHFG